MEESDLVGKVKILVTGHRKIDRALKRIAPAAQRQVFRKASREALREMQREAKLIAPRKTGRLAKAIKIRSGQRSRRFIRIVLAVAKGSFKDSRFYGAFEEFGARGAGTKPTHFMQRAFQRLKNATRDKLEKFMLEAIDRVTRGLSLKGFGK